MSALARRLDPLGPDEGAPAPLAVQPLLAEMFRQATRMSLEVCDASGSLADASTSLDQQTDTLHGILAATQQMASANAALARRVTEMGASADDIGRRMARAVANMDRSVRGAAGGVGGLSSATRAMDATLASAGGQVLELKTSSANIQTVAREIQLLAVNAGVEAARHGAAGRGFAVIAEAVKKLADQTRSAATQTDRLLSQLAQTMAELRAAGTRNLDSVIDADASVAEIVSGVGALKSAENDLGGLLQGFDAVLSPIKSNAEACANVLAHLQAGSQRVDAANDEIQTTAGKLQQVVGLSESLSGLLMGSGVDLPISGLIALCTDGAREIAALFEAALRSGRISREQLFDEGYRPVQGSNPVQHLTAFTSLADEILPPVQEAALSRDRRIAFCAAVDRNGYLPTHNRIFSRPQGDNPVWNAQNARNRRIFDDRTGLASARNTRPVLLQTYRRDMGGGQFAIMSELAAPITVGGRHWGALRLAFKP